MPKHSLQVVYLVTKMKRRTFLQTLAGLFLPVPALTKIPETLQSYEETIVIDQLRSAPVFEPAPEVLKQAVVDVSAVRDAARASLADWLANRVDQAMFEVLGGANAHRH